MYGIVVDKNGYKVDFVLLDEENKPKFYELKADESIVKQDWNIANAMNKPKWDGVKWVETEALPAIPISPDQEIAELKTQLTETDYKIIKCSEYQLAGQPLPYDIQVLHTERQSLRDQINQLEATLS